MTVVEGLVNWLGGYEGGLELVDGLKIDRLEADGQTDGIFKAAQDSQTVFVDGSRDVTVHYLLVVRQPSQTDGMRQDNHEWLEGLERWIYAQNRRQNLPDLGEGRVCFGVQVTNSYAAEVQDETDTVYQVGVAVQYFEEAEK